MMGMIGYIDVARRMMYTSNINSGNMMGGKIMCAGMLPAGDRM